jgi:phenylacetic acid degradation operon negative regulatory protein
MERTKPGAIGMNRSAGNANGANHLPRSQVGTTPQHLMMTLLGDYWYTRTEHIPSAALVELLAEFDVTEPSARAALNRLTKRGLLISSKRGRNTYYGADPVALPLLQEMFERCVAFGAQEARQWDGRWTMVAFSIPEAERRLRHGVRSRLRWLGFAALYDGLWCSPWEDNDPALSTLAEIGVSSCTVFRASIDERSSLLALSAWDLEMVRREYLDFEARFAPILEEAESGRLSASQALVQRTEVMNQWSNFLTIEPGLPSELLPDDWPRSRMRSLCFALHDSLAPVAQERCREIFGRYSPDLAALVASHTAGDLVG